jgi:putative ABC transport system permease protein
VRDRNASASDRIYAALLRLFPGDFRAEFAEEMQADFRDQCLDADRIGGRAAVVLLWIRTTIDIVHRACVEQLDVTKRDAVYALRLVRRNKLFSATAILTLALAIGVNTTIFSIVDGMLFKPLPYHEPDRLVMLSSVRLAGDYPSAMVPKSLAVAVRERHSGLSDLAAVFGTAPLTLVDGAKSTSLKAMAATPNLLDVLGVTPVRGRLPTDEDATSPAAGALLAHATWISNFGADPSLIDRVLRFEDRRVRIVGILPANFVFPSLDASTADLMIAVESPFRGPEIWPTEGAPAPIARLRPNMTLSAAQAEVDALAANLNASLKDWAPPGRQRFRAQLMELQVGLFESRRSVLWTLLAAAGLVLVIACVNLANLLLSRTAGRNREMAVRSVLGASRFRLIRQLTIESGVLALVGGTAGLLLARWSFDFTVRSVPPVFALFLPDALDSRALVFSALATGVSVLLFGAVPALRGSQTALLAGRHERRRIPVLRRLREGHVLVTAETIIVTVLVISAVLTVGSFGRLRSNSLGFQSDNLMSIKLTTRVVQSARMSQVLATVTDEIRRLPGVVSVAAEDTNPIGTVGWSSGQARLPDGKVASAHGVSASYFQAMGLRLVNGRLPSEGEWQGEPLAAVVTERVALALGGAQSALGTSIQILRGDRRAIVIGVVSDIRYRYDDVQPRQVVFIPPPPDRWVAPGLLVRTSGDQSGLDHRIRAVLARAMPRAVPELSPVDAQLARSLALSRFQAQLFGSFAVVAVLLAIVGIHGVLAQTVAGRTREIAIRMALGATSRSVRRHVVTEGLAPVAIGLTLGVVAGFWTVQVFRGYVHGVQLRDPLFFIVAAAIVTAAALAATWIPARRATRIDPATILKTD